MLALAQVPAQGTDYDILATLLDLAQDRNVCASYRAIAERARYAVKTVQRAIMRLARLGAIAIHRRCGGGPGGCNRYFLLPDRAQQTAYVKREAALIASAPPQQKGSNLWVA